MKKFAVAITLQRVKDTLLSDRLSLIICEASNRHEALGIALEDENILSLQSDGFNIQLHIAREIE